MSRVKQNSRLFEHEAYSSTSILLIYHSGLSFPKKLYFLKHRDLLAYVVIAIFVRQLGSDSLEARYPATTTIKNAQAFNRSVSY